MTNERALYIHFDGVDLAGKTTACKNFIEKSGETWETRRNRITCENPIHSFADKLRLARVYDVEVLGHIYYAALLADMRSFVWPTVNTIQDSTIVLRSIAHHTIAKTPRLPEMFTALLDEHPNFDASFVFTASLEARQLRLQKLLETVPETVSNHDRMVADHPKEFQAMEACLIETAVRRFNSTVIDTTAYTPNEVLKIIFEKIPLRK